MTIQALKSRIWEIVEVAPAGDRASKTFDVFILSVIFLNVIAVIVGTIDAVNSRWGKELAWFEVFSVIVFTVEYMARVWACTESPVYGKPVIGRLRFMAGPLPIIDLLAILPFYLPLLGIDLRSIRVFRLFRIIRLAKVVRYYSSLKLITRVFSEKKEELVLTIILMFFLLVFSASVMYYCEFPAQPDKFPNIPATMWWSIATLTTVGYGDIYPVTPLGKVLGSIIAMLGIGMFALPTGILGAGFMEEFKKRKSGPVRCPHCGKEL